MSSGFSTLCANEISSGLASLVGMFRVANHVHVQDTIFMELLDDMLRRDANGRDKDFGLFGNDDVHELIERAFGVVKLYRG